MINHNRLRLEDLLSREIDAAQSLTQTLASERIALTGDSPDAVKDKAAEKIRLVGHIEEMEVERRALWDTFGNDATALGKVAADRWRGVMELMAGCNAANEVNGYIVHIRMNQIRQLFDIVRGGAPLTYGPAGKTFARPLRALAQA